MLDSPEGVCAGQIGFEYPATSVPFSRRGGSVVLSFSCDAQAYGLSASRPNAAQVASS
jgi:hypothetical protein